MYRVKVSGLVDVIHSLTRLSTLKKLVLQGYHTSVAEASALKVMLLSTHNQVLRTVTMSHCNILILRLSSNWQKDCATTRW